VNPTTDGLRARADAALEQRRARPVPAWLTSRRNRRALALVPLAVLMVGIGAGVAPDGVLRAALEFSAIALGLAGTQLRRVTRLLDAMPDRLLDEREIAERNDASRRAYHLATGTAGVLFLAAAASDVVFRVTGSALISAGGWVPALLGGFLAVTIIPSAVAAWRWKDVAEG
jgi:hypothetical protein